MDDNVREMISRLVDILKEVGFSHVSIQVAGRVEEDRHNLVMGGVIWVDPKLVAPEERRDALIEEWKGLVLGSLGVAEGDCKSVVQTRISPLEN